MAPAPGTTIQDPVTAVHKPDLRSSLRDITEYFEQQGAYDLFENLLKELVINKPEDPLQHMIDCLQTEHPCGPLQVIVSSAPGLNRSDFARRLAAQCGLLHISAGDLLRSLKVPTEDKTWQDLPPEFASLVMEKIQMANKEKHGWVLDGFPRTRQQATFLMEACISPTHILVLKAPDDYIRSRNEQRLAGDLPGEGYAPEVLEEKLKVYACHSGLALQHFSSKVTVFNATVPDTELLTQMERVVRTLPKSNGPRLPARVVIFGPRGASARQHASSLAAHLGAVFVDGTFLKENAMTDPGRTASWPAAANAPKSEYAQAQLGAKAAASSFQVGNLQNKVDQDSLGVLGVRLRHVDCQRYGWVLSGGVPASVEEARLLKEDADLQPLRVIVLESSVKACCERLHHQAVDPVTGQVYTTRPDSEVIRSRLQRDPADEPAAVEAQHKEYMAKLPDILQALDAGSRCVRIAADGDFEAVFKEIAEFVERPLPLEQLQPQAAQNLQRLLARG
eukprot:CAMPEP_0178439068 /NCGR_PEP_ID=MMETSP0689_2-20121128/35950_1 /TAXON_ID=160604 /ORGANISM="Amphidinium massartii, Strain CS-259" /LENGTH=505 /DNA_ID=CAMNT_0020061555 /DNA_START=35 /DNA_END=1549 /DNA_ORIENTATION=+